MASSDNLKTATARGHLEEKPSADAAPAPAAPEISRFPNVSPLPLAICYCGSNWVLSSYSFCESTPLNTTTLHCSQRLFGRACILCSLERYLGSWEFVWTLRSRIEGSASTQNSRKRVTLYIKRQCNIVHTVHRRACILVLRQEKWCMLALGFCWF